MGSPVVNVYVCCDDKHAGGNARPSEAGEVGTREGLPRFDRFRFFNGNKDTGSGAKVTGVKYTPSKAGSDGTQVLLGTVDDKAGVNHLNANGGVKNMKPDTILVKFTPDGDNEKKATLALANGLIANGYYLRRAVFELRSGPKLFVDFIYGKDVDGSPDSDLIDAEIELIVTNA